MSNIPVVIIPYRDREEHLKSFVPAFREAAGDMPIFVIEQANDKSFNRAKLLNIGAKIAFEDGATHIITHDVDMLPVVGETVYYLGDAVHLAVNCTQFGGKLPYERYFGGVTVFSKQLFYAVNGYSNEYWGWGGEDDDMLLRVEKIGLRLQRPDKSKFISLAHEHALNLPDAKKTHKNNCTYLNSAYDYSKDGLNTLKYEELSTEEIEKGVFKIKVDI